MPVLLQADRILARSLINTYLHFCLYLLIGGILVVVGLALFVVVRVQMELPPIPVDASPTVVAAVPMLAFGTVLGTAILLTLRRSRNGWVWASLIIVSIAILSFVGAVAYFVVPPNARMSFQRETGLDWPSGATIVSVGDTHGGFLGDGEFHVILDVDDSAINQLLKTLPKAPLSKWTPGPVPGIIGVHCRFGTDGVSVGSHNDEPEHYVGDPELVSMFGSPDVMYSAQEYCCESLPWHNGTLIVVDPTAKRIWLSIWDF